MAKSDPYGRTTFRDKPFDNRSKSALIWAEKKWLAVAPKKRKPWKLYQGMYSVGESPNSKGTHDGGGAIDVDVRGMTTKQKRGAVKWLRRAGWAAWLRPRMSDTWPEHIHAVLRGHRNASVGAKQQMVSYDNRRNGLANNAVDTTWRPKKPRRWSHRQGRPVIGK